MDKCVYLFLQGRRKKQTKKLLSLKLSNFKFKTWFSRIAWYHHAAFSRKESGTLSSFPPAPASCLWWFLALHIELELHLKKVSLLPSVFYCDFYRNLVFNSVIRILFLVLDSIEGHNMLLRTVIVPGTGSTNIGQQSSKSQRVLFCFGIKSFWMFYWICLANKEKSSDWDLSCFIWRICGTECMFVCTCTWEHW